MSEFGILIYYTKEFPQQGNSIFLFIVIDKSYI